MNELLIDISNRQNDIKLYHYKTAIILGVGGIGSWVALDLALSGCVDTLYLIDPDIVEISNLNRTPFRLCDITKLKVDALKYLILERRPVTIHTHACKTNPELIEQLKRDLEISKDRFYLHNQKVIIDCRDDVYDDFYDWPLKYYKVGYDGLSCTIDGNPRNTAVWGRANGYRVTPSFLCPTQMVANLVVTDLLVRKTDDEMNPYSTTNVAKDTGNFDQFARFNKYVTFNCNDVLEQLFRESNSGA